MSADVSQGGLPRSCSIFRSPSSAHDSSFRPSKMTKSSTVKDLTAGTAGGILQVLVGQPFDIVKVGMTRVCWCRRDVFSTIFTGL